MFKSAFCTLALALLATTANSETITLKLGEQGQEVRQQINLPKHGDTMQSVEKQFGEPNSISNAVGEPPITTWHYDLFSVYFEHQTVIHSVVEHKKTPSSDNPQ